MRKCNLILEGINESENEDLRNVFRQLLTDVLHVNINTETEIDKIHRFGKSVSGRPRPIAVKFLRHNVRDSVLSSAKNLKNHQERIYINEDLPAPIKARRSELRAIVQHARSTGVNAKQSGDKIVIEGQWYDQNTTKCLPPKFSLETVRTQELGSDATSFFSKHSPFSNFSPAAFVVNHKTYNCVEQFFQATKSSFAGRDDVTLRIMKESDPLQMKKTWRSNQAST